MLNNSSDVYNGLFGNINGDRKRTSTAYSDTNGEFPSSPTYAEESYSKINGSLNGQLQYASNGISSPLEDEKTFESRLPKTNYLPDVLKNGLLIN